MKYAVMAIMLLSSVSLGWSAEIKKNYGYIAGEASQEIKDQANKPKKERKFTNPFKILFDLDKSLRPVLW